MSNIDIIRAWKDAAYRQSLTDEQRAELPDHPSGVTSLGASEMESIAGGGAGGAGFHDTCAVATFCVIVSETAMISCTCTEDPCGSGNTRDLNFKRS